MYQIIVRVIYFNVILRVFVLAVSAVLPFVVAVLSFTRSTAAFVFFLPQGRDCCRTTQTFSRLCGIFKCFIHVCSISSSQRMRATVSAIANKIKTADPYPATAQLFLVMLLHALPGWSRKYIKAIVSKGVILTYWIQ